VTESPEAYPVHLYIDHQPEYNRLLPLVKWLLLLPHYIVLAFLTIAAFVAVLIASVAVVFNRRYPRGLFDFVLGVFRWGVRVTAYLLLMTDRYPPFSLADDPGQPVRFDIEYPEEVDRWRGAFQWILAIPYLLIARILQEIALLLVLFAFFTILFTKRFPPGMFSMALVVQRWNARGYAYACFMTTRYPPFVWA
jgi:ABC-type amino acid transport substrate-binding protein